jgi:putative colanic acid biosynthesis acetyltransferase WcaF
MTSSLSPEPATKASRLSTLEQETFYSSPWSIAMRLRMALWEVAWLLLCRWTPKPLRPWRIAVLRLFGAKTEGIVFVASSARIKMPWNLTMEARSCIGAYAQIYNLAPVTLGERATVAQEVYVCCGTHKFDDPALPLVVGPIHIGPDAFLGARAFIHLGVSIGAGAMVGACSVVTRDVEPWTISVGNPSRFIKHRKRFLQ